MATLNEGQHRGEFIVSEANGHRSRETVTLAGGQNLAAGTVVGQLTVGATATSTADAGNTGNGTMGAVTVGAGAKAGTYVLTIIEPAANAGAFMVEDPDGENVGTGNVGVAFTGGGLSFTLADGATDFVSGDQFTIAVAAGSNEYVQLNPAAFDGSEVAVAILYDNVNATAAALPAAVIARDAEVNGAELVWPVGISPAAKTTALSQLADVGLIVR